MSWPRTTLIALTALGLTGCGADTPDVPPVDVSAACATVSTGSAVPRCGALWTDGQALRAPAGTDSAPVGALVRGGEHFVTGAGKTLKLTAAAASAAVQDQQYASTLYQATVEDGRVTALEPVLTVPDQVVLAGVFGAKLLTGTITPYAGDDSYAENPSLPVVLQFDATAGADGLTGHLVNAATSVALSDGTCAPALQAAGAGNPLQGEFTATVVVDRVPSMHEDFDDELVLSWTQDSSGMGGAFYPSVATLMGQDPLGSDWEVTQHGTPDSGPGLRLALSTATVTAGGC